MTATECLQQIRATYSAHAHANRAAQMSAYMRNLFPFYGLPSPLRAELSKKLIATWPPLADDQAAELCARCFGEDEKREVQYFVRDWLLPQRKRLEPERWMPRLEALITQRTWWDSVDFIAPKLAGALLLRAPKLMEQYTGAWIEHQNFWYQRSALIFQLDYKGHTRSDLLFDYVLRRSDSQEFFVQKGAGWALRQYARTNPLEVRNFLVAHRDRLSALTLREGGKHVLA